MKTHCEHPRTDDDSIAAGLLCGVLLLIWCTVRVPMLIVLAFLEPFVRLLLSGVAVLSLFAGLVYKGSSVPPPIPFWVTVCVSVGCLMLVSIYHAVLRFLSR